LFRCDSPHEAPKAQWGKYNAKPWAVTFIPIAQPDASAFGILQIKVNEAEQPSRNRLLPETFVLRRY